MTIWDKKARPSVMKIYCSGLTITGESFPNTKISIMFLVSTLIFCILFLLLSFFSGFVCVLFHDTLDSIPHTYSYQNEAKQLLPICAATPATSSASVPLLASVGNFEASIGTTGFSAAATPGTSSATVALLASVGTFEAYLGTPVFSADAASCTFSSALLLEKSFFVSFHF